MGCNHNCGVGMMQTPELRAQAHREKIYDCAHLFPKQLLLPEHRNFSTSLNVAVGNSLGGSGRRGIPACWDAIKTADHTVYCDGNPLYPDSAVMMKELFANKINKVGKDVLHDLFHTRTGTVRKFVAVQHNGRKQAHTNITVQMNLASGLDEVSRGLNATIVLFCGRDMPRQ